MCRRGASAYGEVKAGVLEGESRSIVKGSRRKLGWNFRKRSTRHQVLSNTVISENSSSGKKESPKTRSIDFHIQSESDAPQKISVSEWMDGMPSLTTSMYSKLDNALIAKECIGQNDPLLFTVTDGISSTTTSESRSKITKNLMESSIIVIQSYVRRYLAQKNLLKLKQIVKLQAAFRGHLERRKAAGTLRCVQAIIKMQALVRASQAHLPKKQSATEEKIAESNEKTIQSQVTSEKELSGSNANTHYSSTEKLLTRGFSRHLLESAPKKNPIHIQCDPLKPDSAWLWLQRWVSVSSDTAQAQKLDPRNLEREETDRASELDENAYNSMDLRQNVENVASSDECENNLIAYDFENIKLQACYPSSSSTKDVMNMPQFDDADLRKALSISLTNYSSQLEIQLGASKKTPASTSKKPETDCKQPRRSLKRVSYGQPETEGKKIVVGLRKARNPTFAAVHSKFEKLSSSRISSSSNSSQVVGAETKFDIVSSTAASEMQRKDQSVAESLISHEPRLLDGGSRCEIVHCIPFALSSPVTSEVGLVEYEQETKTMEKSISGPSSTFESGYIHKDLDGEAKTSSVTSESNTSFNITKLELDNVQGESVEAVLPVNSAPLEKISNSSLPDLEIQIENPPNKKRNRSSPDVSPKTDMTVQQVYITPSSQVSVNSRMNKADKSGSRESRKSPLAGKRSLSNPNFDSCASSTEKRPRDPKSGKRRNSFATSRLNHVDLDLRDADSNSLPNYMQATESARAKAHANVYLRSVTDVPDKHIYVKKRHSLPGASGKQLSQQMQQSLSQAQGLKGSGAHDQVYGLVPDKKWQW